MSSTLIAHPYDGGLDPEAVNELEDIIQEIYRLAEEHVPVGDGLRSMLATAAIEGVKAGISDRAELQRFALRAIPSFRRTEAAV